MIFSSLFFCAHQFCETMVPVAIGLIVARAIDTGDGSAMIVSLFGLAALFVVLTYAYRFGARIIIVAIEREAHMMRVEVAARALHPRGVRTELVSGELLSVSTSDAEKTSWILDVIARTAAAITATVVCAVALLVIDIPLGIAVLVGTPLIMFVLQRAAPLLTRTATAQQAEVARVSGMATDFVSGCATASRHRCRERGLGPICRLERSRTERDHEDGPRQQHLPRLLDDCQRATLCGDRRRCRSVRAAGPHLGG